MGPTINWGNIPTISHVSISHAGELAPTEALRIVQRGELIVPAATTRRLFALIDELAGERAPAPRTRAGSLFDGAQFNLYGTPAELAEAVGRRVGLEVRLAT
jgi:hypothetical protein